MRNKQITDKQTFTSREQEVMNLMCRGYSNREIAKSLGISFFTAKAHVCSILHKTGVKNRLEAVVKYICTRYDIKDFAENKA